ncbi:unnamed protein product [Vitrella brassicaformis CCMP3155]|uniref:Uncharacterized protein n=1 Tax=Vitrella brassicaformis (strain CCMP3155) TaxID=1169540 RepID=A0A0G4E8F7_VITBC|nr:unnamed protein product [Vitrella brassicaformis CCMP3155]|eukprot:CEL91751.1 unnamed protein product [Vitrella brassicaformis CCMP3155]
MQAVLAEPRVVALWKLVGRHVELFDDGDAGLRHIKDDESFWLELAPRSRDAMALTDRPLNRPFPEGVTAFIRSPGARAGPTATCHTVLLTPFNHHFIAGVNLSEAIASSTVLMFRGAPSTSIRPTSRR